jgi:hypothetical protein
MPNPETDYRLATAERQAEMNILPIEKQIQIINSLVEGCSVRSTARLVGVEHKTVLRVLLRANDTSTDYPTSPAPALHMSGFRVNQDSILIAGRVAPCVAIVFGESPNGSANIRCIRRPQ